MNLVRGILLVAISAGCMSVSGCGGGGRSKSNSIVTSGQNVQAISVNSGPANNYANGVFTSVTVCIPGTSTCQTVSDVLVDTGSSGLRILSSALTSVVLPQQTGTGGSPVVECLPFLSGVTWGPVQTADIQIAGESASAVPIQVLSDTAFPIAAPCKNTGLPTEDTLQSLGANGILGVGVFAQDCGPGCAQSSQPNVYYLCPSSGCQPTTEPVAQQVQNPVALFASDNNGVIIELPAVNGAEPTASGSLVFGIGTQSNNSLGSATVYTTDNSASFITQFKGQSYPGSFIDSGSNGIFFLDAATTHIPDCSSSKGFYCPTSTLNLSATNQGLNGSTGTVNFNVANADSLFSNQTDAVFSDLAGPGSTNFDWGLPFFFGRNVFTAIEGKSTPGGSGPYWAY
jgi:uncharacterized protein DUF3443